MVISDNDTKLSGRITKDSFSMQRTFAGMGSLGWNVINVPNGHDLPAVYLAAGKRPSSKPRKIPISRSACS